MLPRGSPALCWNRIGHHESQLESTTKWRFFTINPFFNYRNSSNVYGNNVIPADSGAEKSNLGLMCNTGQQWRAHAINVNQLILPWRKAALRCYATLYVSNAFAPVLTGFRLTAGEKWSNLYRGSRISNVNQWSTDVQAHFSMTMLQATGIEWLSNTWGFEVCETQARWRRF